MLRHIALSGRCSSLCFEWAAMPQGNAFAALRDIVGRETDLDALLLALDTTEVTFRMCSSCSRGFALFACGANGFALRLRALHSASTLHHSLGSANVGKRAVVSLNESSSKG